MNPTIAPGALFDELDPELVRCPYALYDQFRADPPVYREEVEAVVVTRFEDVQRVIADASTFSSSQVRGPVSISALGEVLGRLPPNPPRWPS